MSRSLHRAVSAYLHAVRQLQAADADGGTNYTPLVDALHQASATLLPLLEDILPAELLDRMRKVDEGFEASTAGIIDFSPLRSFGAEIVLAMERVRRDCGPPADSAAGSDASPDLQLLLAECPPHPPEPPSARIEAAAQVVVEAISAGRLTPDGERELRLTALTGLPQRPDAAPGVDANGYRWAVRRLTEAGLVTVVMAPPPPSLHLSELYYRKRDGRPVKDAKGKFLPEVAKPKPPVPYIRSTPELWNRWRAGQMFPDTGRPADTLPVADHPTLSPGANRKRRKLKACADDRRKALNTLQVAIVALHRPGASNQITAELALKNDDVRRLAKELGKGITAGFVQSCRTSQRKKARAREARKNSE